jgi:medium-chain acyl-[acyl-carrier-protein] hydrolase
MDHIAGQAYWPLANSYSGERTRPTRVLCLPHAGGSVGVYGPWLKAGAPELEVIPVHLPGRPGRLADPLPTDMQRLVSDLLRDLEPWLGEPFALFGHSMGGLIAYELARALLAGGQRPECLIVSGTGPPDTADPVAVTEMDDTVLADWLMHLGGTPAEVLGHPDLLRLTLRTLRADLTLLERYGAPEPTAIPIPITAFGGREDERAPVWKMAKWQRVTSREFQQRTFPGGHFFLHEFRQPVLAEIARTVCSAISRPWG